MIPLLALIRKDMRLFFADKRAVIMSFVAPIAIAAFFGYVFGGNGQKKDASRIAVLLVDQDASEISRSILTDLTANKLLDVRAADIATARAAVRKGTATVAVVIPKEFGAQAGQAFFRSDRKPDISVFYDPSHSAEQGMVQGILTGSVMQVVSREVFGGTTGNAVVRDALADLDRNLTLPPGEKQSLRGLLQSVEQWNARRQVAGAASDMGGGLSVPYQIHEEAVTARSGVQYNGYAHSFGGMSVQFILFMGIDVGIGMLLLRQRGLWKRLRAAPLSRGLLLGSRAISAALTSMLILTVVFGVARLVFGVRIEGSLAGFIGVCLAFSLMTAAFGLLVAALGKTPEATRGLSILATLVMLMLSGAWVPAFLFPRWMQTATMFIPTRWAMDGLDAMTWRGLDFSAAMGPIGVLLLSSAVFGAIAVSRFKWEADG